MVNFLDSRLPPSFWQKVSPCPVSGCWIWIGMLAWNGYGRLNRYENNVKREHKAHRYAFERLVGEVPAGLQLDHLCRVRCCVNPAHLEVVTHAENVARGESGKYLASRTHCPRGHAYSGTNLIVRHRKEGWRARDCRACLDERNARRKGAA